VKTILSIVPILKREYKMIFGTNDSESKNQRHHQQFSTGARHNSGTPETSESVAEKANNDLPKESLRRSRCFAILGFDILGTRN